ncbi:hypothetical protein CHARACLAT_032601 [Characodon lateralis]|uniref:Secreted protein n=1 Tax=Characodon lateralis TaxID=208331 RepID=A0ABU7EGL4_9TELE|nr:hypothetical protein [Characodon lateralis]
MENRRVTGGACLLISQCAIRERTASTSVPECFATNGAASSSRSLFGLRNHKYPRAAEFHLLSSTQARVSSKRPEHLSGSTRPLPGGYPAPVHCPTPGPEFFLCFRSCVK